MDWDDIEDIAGVVAVWALFIFGLAYHLGFIEFI
jgi:hypothetical protein